MDNREKESPARTIDSCGSTAASMETIVDRNSQIQQNEDLQQQQNHIQNQTAAMENSTNTTNCNKNSLTNSQISMISNNNDSRDPQHHIYTSPDLVLGPERKPLKKFREDIIPIKPLDDEGKRKLEMLKAKGKSLDLISVKSTTLPVIKKVKKTFPKFIILGIVQLVLSISLVALGSLLLIREAALSTTGSGIWSGAIAAIAGALGVINIGGSRAGFLAVSLICVASSTLAIALTGSGLVRDINAMEQHEEFNLMNSEAAVSAGCGLIFALALHLLVSIVSVYQSAIKLCSRQNNDAAQMLENIITVNNASMVNKQKVEEYFNSMSASDKEKILSGENIDKLMAMWMYSSKRGPAPQPPSVKKGRPIMLVPATAGNGLPPQMLPPGCRNPGILLPPGILTQAPSMLPPPPGFQFPPPYPPPGTTTVILPDGSYRMQSSRPSSEIHHRHHRSRQRRPKNDPNRRQRRKSDSDAENRKAFTYTGLDRTIADNFLERQEQSNNGSHVDYSSSSNDSYRGVKNVAL